MNILYIFGITILLMERTDSLNEDAKTDKDLQQWILLRKLQNLQETKPPTWNEVLADVLVNKIRIFSFTSENKEDVTKDDAPISKEKTILTDFFSKTFVVYKKFIYDVFVGKRKASDDELVHATILPDAIEDGITQIDPEEVIVPTEIIFVSGPKSEVEFVEPKYHGKIEMVVTTENPGKNIAGLDENNNIDPVIIRSEMNNHAPHVKAPDDQVNVDPGLEESVTECANGFVKNESGDCVKNVSRLILSVPNQCPTGYRQDWWGYCRKVFRF